METGLLGATGAHAQQLAVTVQCTGGARATTPRLRMAGNHARARDMNQPNVEWRHAHVSLKFCCILFKNSRKALEFKRPCQACCLGDYCLSFSRRDDEWCCTPRFAFQSEFWCFKALSLCSFLFKKRISLLATQLFKAELRWWPSTFANIDCYSSWIRVRATVLSKLFLNGKKNSPDV